MIEDEAVLLRAVLDAPDDDAPRLVYADALLDAGDPRGELITLQCAIARATEPDPVIVARAEQLIAAHRSAWEQMLGSNLYKVFFHRGFACTATVRCRDRSGDALAALDRAPIVNITLGVSPDDEDNDSDEFDEEYAAGEEDESKRPHLEIARWFARDPRTARIRALDLTRAGYQGWGEPAFAALLGADLRMLDTLYVGDFDCQTHAAVAIAACASFERLEELAFYGDYYAELDEGAGVLAASPRMASLRRLTMNCCALGPGAAEAIASSPHLAGLTELELSGGSYQANRIGEVGFVGLAGSTKLPALQRLSLGNNEVTDAGLLVLAEDGGLPALGNLAVNSCDGITGVGIAALARAPRFARIEELWVGGCPIGADGAIAIATSPHAVNLRCLNLHGCAIGPEGAAALASSPYLDKLVYLSVSEADSEPALRARFGKQMQR